MEQFKINLCCFGLLFVLFFSKGNCQSTNVLDTKTAALVNQKPVVISASLPLESLNSQFNGTDVLLASSNSQPNGTDVLPIWMTLAKTFMESMIQKFKTPTTISNLTSLIEAADSAAADVSKFIDMKGWANNTASARFLDRWRGNRPANNSNNWMRMAMNWIAKS